MSIYTTLIGAKAMTNKVFVDTSAWFSILNSQDNNHSKVTAAYKELLNSGTRLITSNHVLGETYTLLSRKTALSGRAQIWAFIDLLDRSSQITIQHLSYEVEKEAYAILKTYHDQQFSFVDATSFALMHKEQINTALTLDQHFLQMGFTILP